jgi:hypothetical protein
VDDDYIGELPHKWNVLAGYDKPADFPRPANIHYTIGGPYFHEYRNIDWADQWIAERNDMLHCSQVADVQRSEVAETI